MMEQQDTSGFYKLDGSLLYGPNFVLNVSYELRKDMRDQYQYPIDGWYWFDTELDAKTFFGLPIEPINNSDSGLI